MNVFPRLRIQRPKTLYLSLFCQSVGQYSKALFVGFVMGSGEGVIGSERKRWRERFHSRPNLSKISLMHFYGLILDLSLSSAFPPLGQRLPLLGRRHEHLVIIYGSLKGYSRGLGHRKCEKAIWSREGERKTPLLPLLFSYSLISSHSLALPLFSCSSILSYSLSLLPSLSLSC